MTGYETILATIVLARMTAAPKIVTDPSNVRRAHRTVIPRTADTSYAVHVIDGDDQPVKGKVGNASCAWREGGFTLSLFARNDLGPTVLDGLRAEVMRRMSPYTVAYPAGVCINPGRITIDTDIADGDVVKVDMEFGLTYPVCGEWSLELP